MSLDVYALRDLVEREFPDLVESTVVVRDKLRVLFSDSSYVDFWWSQKFPGRFAHHWERRHVDRTIYRHDNMPHGKWKKIGTFPFHFHDGSEEVVRDSFLSSQPEEGIRSFLTFVRAKIHIDEERTDELSH